MAVTAYVDPGLDRTGVCWYPDRDTQEIRTSLIEGGRGGGWTTRKKAVEGTFRQILTGMHKSYRVERVVFEFPENYLGSEKGFASAGQQSTLKLAALVGGLMATCSGPSLRDIRTAIVTPREWKGQLPKQVVAQRIKKATGKSYPADIEDAVGMALTFEGII